MTSLERVLSRPNLLRIDDVLLRAGAITALAWAAGLLVWLAVSLGAAEAGASLGRGALGWPLAAAAAPVALIVAGVRVRRRERRAWALARLIDTHVEIAAEDLIRDSDFTPATLDRAIRDLNNAGAAVLVWDRASGRVQDGRPRGLRVHVDECGSCGAKISLELSIGDCAAARCPYCHDPVSPEELIEERARLVEALDGDAASDAEARAGSGFSAPVFVLLMLAFWPFAIAYALWHWRASGPGRGATSRHGAGSDRGATPLW